MNAKSVGSAGEDRAAAYLLDLGYLIVTRRKKTRRGEIDIVALDGDVLVFVEVKVRRSRVSVAEEALDAKKIARLAAAAEDYLLEMGNEFPGARYDFITIGPGGLKHYKDAWRP